MVITRGSILREVLIEKEDLMYRYSKFRAGLTALEGYEQIFEDLKKTCELLRGMIRNADEREHEEGLMKFARENREALQHPEIQKKLADWQMEIIKRDASGIHPVEDMKIGPLDDPGPHPANMKWNPFTQAWDEVNTPGTMTPDEALLRRRYRNAEGFKPEPVIKTDESGVYLNGEKVLPKPVVYPGGEE